MRTGSGSLTVGNLKSTIQRSPAKCKVPLRYDLTGVTGPAASTPFEGESQIQNRNFNCKFGSSPERLDQGADWSRALLHRFSYRSIARAHGTQLAIARVSVFRKRVIYVELDLLLRDRA